MPDTFFVYLVQNKIDGKVYIGKTNNIHRRWNQHKASARRGDGHYLHKAILKHGQDNFSVEELERSQSEQQAHELEKVYIRLTNATDPSIGYNLTFGGEGVSGNEEVRKKLSEHFKGEKSVSYRHDIPTEEVVRLYQGGKTLEEIAEQFRSSTTPIRKRLRAAGVKIRNTGNPKGTHVGKDNWNYGKHFTIPSCRKFSDEDAINLYKSGLSLAEVGEKLGVCHSAINRRLILLGVTKRSRGVAARKGSKNTAFRQDIPTDEVVSLYMSGLGATSIGKRFNTSAATIYGRLIKAGMKTRPLGHNLLKSARLNV
jgi:group I intron endonuclease